MTPAERFFLRPENPAHRRYEALRAFHVEGKKAKEVSGLFGYTLSTVYTLVRNFKRLLDSDHPDAQFFVSTRPGRKEKDTTGTLNKLIVELRKKYLSVPEIKAILDSLDDGNVSEKYVYNILKKEGFARLPRRTRLAKDETHATVKIEAAKSELLEYIYTRSFSNRAQHRFAVFAPPYPGAGNRSTHRTISVPGNEEHTEIQCGFEFPGSQAFQCASLHS